MSDNENESEKRETLADVLAEMRRRLEMLTRAIWAAPVCDSAERQSAQAEVLSEYIGRIEAAWKREQAFNALVKEANERLREHLDIALKANKVGNAAAMREALLKCREIALQWQADEADGVAGTTDKPQARSAAEAVIDMEFEINAALSAPSRVCDVNTLESLSDFVGKTMLTSDLLKDTHEIVKNTVGEGGVPELHTAQRRMAGFLTKCNRKESRSEPQE